MSTLVGASFAQEKTLLPYEGGETFHQIDMSASDSEKSLESYWTSYSTEYSAYYGSTPVGLFMNNLFPDSTVLDDGYVDANQQPIVVPVNHQVHAQIFDFASDVYIGNGTTNISAGYDIQLDSIQIAGLYERVNNAVVDTLVVNVVPASASNLNSLFYFASATMQANYGDTVFFLGLDWDFPSKSTPGSIGTYKIPLDDALFADSNANGLHFPTVGTNLTIPASAAGKFAVVLDFIPGQTTWNANQDTLGVSINGWSTGASELNGQNTYRNYERTDYTTAAWVDKDVSTNTAGGWNGSFLPAYAYGQALGSEDFAITLKVTQDNVVLGLDEDNNEIKLGQNMPNPFNQTSRVSFELPSTQEVSLEIMDLSGKIVQNKNVGILNAGIHTIEINAENLNSGVYFYTLVSGTSRTTNKMVVKK